MDHRDEHDVWADEEYSRASLRDERRVSRLVAIAAEVARQPAGKVTTVFPGSAEREGAFRFLENDAIDAASIAASSYAATLSRCVPYDRVFVAVDSTSVSLTDHANRKGFGRVGISAKPSRGLYTMNALAVAPDGVPLGLVEQHWWARDKPKAPRPKSKNGSYRANFQA